MRRTPRNSQPAAVSSLLRARPCRRKGYLPAEHAGSLHQKGGVFVLNGNGFPFGRAAAHSLEKLQRDGTTGLRLHALPPELELRVDGAVKQEVLMEALRVKRTDGGVVADLLGYESEPQVFPGDKTRTRRAGAGGTVKGPHQ